MIGFYSVSINLLILIFNISLWILPTVEWIQTLLDFYVALWFIHWEWKLLSIVRQNIIWFWTGTHYFWFVYLFKNDFVLWVYSILKASGAQGLLENNLYLIIQLVPQNYVQIIIPPMLCLDEVVIILSPLLRHPVKWLFGLFLIDLDVHTQFRLGGGHFILLGRSDLWECAWLSPVPRHLVNYLNIIRARFLILFMPRRL